MTPRCRADDNERERVTTMRFSLSRNARLVTFGLHGSFRIHEPCELRLSEGQQRADGFRFDVQHSGHGVGLDALVAKPQGDGVGVGEGLERLGVVHASTVRIDVGERLGSALPISCGDAGLPWRRESRLWAGPFPLRDPPPSIAGR
jgi:hypothetical protein